MTGEFAAEAAQPFPWQTNFQPAVTPVMEKVNEFHWLLLAIVTVITLFVLALMLICIVRFNARSNPVPSKTTHNTLLEVIWTTVPVMILVVIAIPSFRLLYYSDRAIEAEMTIKAIGNQWFWTYEYPDHGNFAFDAIMKEENELEAGEPRLLATDNAIVVPTNTNIRILVTASDVIHSWAMPAFGVKIDGVPGRLNETWFNVAEPGVYYGQCSELCGVRHGFMPIMVRAVSKAAFESWVEEAKEEFADAGLAPVHVADGAADTSR